jgi:hypothetical protein
MREFVVDLTDAESYGDFVSAFNEGFCHHVTGDWRGTSWDAFHDYLSWPNEESYRLIFRAWGKSKALRPDERAMIEQICHDNPHVQVTFA